MYLQQFFGRFPLELIPGSRSAYDLYKQRSKGGVNQQLDQLVTLFNTTFARNVKVHFLGTWYVVGYHYSGSSTSLVGKGHRLVCAF
jgi:hypothetical protein